MKREAPLPEQIKMKRAELKITQESAAHTVHVFKKTWQRWENGEREMHPAFWELFLIKTKDF